MGDSEPLPENKQQEFERAVSEEVAYQTAVEGEVNRRMGQQGMAIGALPQLESKQYSEAHYKFLASLIDSTSARKFFEQICETDFSLPCILAFHKVLTSGFDRNAILAFNKDIRIRVIDFEIALNFMVIECHETDLQNPAFLTFQENILQTFKDFISRSQDAEERKRLLKSEYEVTQASSQGQNRMEETRWNVLKR